MGVLLLLVGVLTLASGAVKLRERARSAGGNSSLALAEVIVGLGVIVGSGVGLSQLRPTAWALVALALTLIVMSTWRHASQVAQKVKKRQASEEWRLKAHLMSQNEEHRTSNIEQRTSNES